MQSNLHVQSARQVQWSTQKWMQKRPASSFSRKIQKPSSGACRLGLYRECLTLTLCAPELSHQYQPWSTHLRVTINRSFYWGHKEILIPVYKNMADAMKKHPDADVLINFASLRSAYDSTIDTLAFPQVRTIAIIAEGIPENLTRVLIKRAKEKGVSIIGPATVGGIKPGCFKIGNTGGMMDNILHSKLYRPGR
ncbi:ATP-citrate synthase-like [Macrobrachium nipponense]|uniref:ATP-citrate synthase-like n=1 Tax=Macrobrachium nipponense TaxID=159736 RepID=UPI0030C847FE